MKEKENPSDEDKVRFEAQIREIVKKTLKKGIELKSKKMHNRNENEMWIKIDREKKDEKSRWMEMESERNKKWQKEDECKRKMQ